MLVIGNSKFHLLFWEEDGVTVDVGWEKEEEFGIDGDSVFPIPEWVGGRFSLWGSAGLIIAISIGSENYREL